jgi:hypothetical protein
MVDHREDQSGPVLTEAQLAREGRLETRHAPFAEHQLRIPVYHMTQWHMLHGVLRSPLVNRFPGLDSRNHDEFEAAYDRFFKSPDADPYRVRSRQAQLGHV